MHYSLSAEQRLNARGWAHFALATAQALDAKRLLTEDGIETVILVDADIVVTKARLSEHRHLFRDLLNASPDQSKNDNASLAAAMGAYFFSWLFAPPSKEQSLAPNHRWLIAPEHYSEVVHNAKTLFEKSRPNLTVESDSNLETSEQVTAAQVERLRALAEDLKTNPWAEIDSELAELFHSFGIELVEPTPLTLVKHLLEWVKTNRSHVIGTVSLGQPTSLICWPKFASVGEQDTVRLWREVLTQTSRADAPFGAVETDARVLAAMTILNEGWREKKLRVVLLTNSQYILRAVEGKHLNPRLRRAESSNPVDQDLIEDFIRLSSIVLAIPEPEPQADTGIEAVPPSWQLLLSDRPPSIAEQRDLFKIIANRSERKSIENSGTEKSGETSGNFPPRFEYLLTVPFKKYFYDTGATRYSLAQVAAEFEAKRKRSIEAFDNSLRTSPDPIQYLTELKEASRVRALVDLLELLIATDSVVHSVSMDEVHANPLRAPPFVDLDNLPSAMKLAKAFGRLVEEQAEAVSPEELLHLKLSVYKEDPTTYLLVLVFAQHYAHQGRWVLAVCAADYALKLSKTSAYSEKRAGYIKGEEAVLLGMACRRRAARSLDEVNSAIARLENWETLDAEDPQAAQLRLCVERISTKLTRLFMLFFGSTDFRSSLRAEADETLRAALDLWKDVGADQPVDWDTEDTPTYQWDIYQRMVVNICNLAWLTVSWSWRQVLSGQQLGSKQTPFSRHQTPESLAIVEDCLKRLQVCVESSASRRYKPTGFDRITFILSALHLAPTLLDWSSEAIRQRWQDDLSHMGGFDLDHPYDKKRVEYATRLAVICKPRMGSSV